MAALHGNNTFVFDSHMEPHHDVTNGQLTFFSIWIGAGFIWLIRFLKSSSRQEKYSAKEVEQNFINVQIGNNKNDETGDAQETILQIGKDGGQCEKTETETAAVRNFSAVRPPPTTDEFLQSVVTFGIIMIYFYLCDYRKVNSHFISLKIIF